MFNKMHKKFLSLVCLGLAAVMLFAGCAPDTKPPELLPPDYIEITGEDLMKGITPSNINAVAIDNAFTRAAADFSVELFKKTIADDKNSLISPTSVLLALAMTANGADKTTLAQMEAVLGGKLKLQELNEYLYSYVKNLPSEEKSRLEIANSIWFKDKGFTANRDFLQTNADYYGADAYQAPFDDKTVDDINNWVKEKTDGMIDSILDEIPDEAIMYLINAIMFDAEWAKKYEDVSDGQFTAYNGAKRTVKFMSSDENIYLHDDGAKGFIKPYFGNRYSFAAILPDANIPINSYVASLTGEKLMNILNSAVTAKVTTAMPKFEYDYDITMNNALIEMGIKDAFDSSKANFSKTGSAGGNIFIAEVKHKAFISVSELGTRAAAVTSVEKGATGAPGYQYTVRLDRPFVYAIIDNATNLPLFLGTFITAG